MRGRLVKRTWRHDPALYAPARFRKACSYEAFIPDPVAGFGEPVGLEVTGIVSDAEHAIQGLNSRARPALAPLARLLLRTESIASSRVEGMHVDAKDLARAEARLEAGGKAGAESTEILANVDAMELAVAEASYRSTVTVPDVVAIHAELMRGSATPQIAGRLRTRQNWIGGNAHNPCGADFVPPPVEDVDRLLGDLCETMNEEHLPPLVQAALVHAQFETIHPFDDGNGRTGRALIHVVLRRRGLAPTYVPPVSVVLANDRPGYIRGLTEFRSGPIDAWLSAFAVAAARAAELAARYLDAVEALQDRWRAQLRAASSPRADAAAWAIIDGLPAHPVIGLPVAAVAVGRTKAAVNQGLGQLEEAGVLRPLTGGRRNRSWEATGLLDLLADLESGNPV